ncbi:hypothetical protein [Rhodococcus phenolicus]|nr:hypothetical protein [Rhodococcus phenolicus]
MKAAATLAGITGLCLAGWLTLAVILVDTTANTLYQYGSDHE